MGGIVTKRAGSPQVAVSQREARKERAAARQQDVGREKAERIGMPRTSSPEPHDVDICSAEKVARVRRYLEDDGM